MKFSTDNIDLLATMIGRAVQVGLTFDSYFDKGNAVWVIEYTGGY